MNRLKDSRLPHRSIALATLLCACLSMQEAQAQVATTDAPKASATPPALAPAPAPAVLPLFVVHLTTGPGWQKDKRPGEQPGMREHSQNLARMRNEGALVIGARYKDSVADKGMVVVRAANIEAVEAQFAADPMVRDKLFVLDIAAFSPFYDGFVARPSNGAVVTSRPPAPVDAFAWLAGCWAGNNGKSSFREHWMRPTGGMMMGMALTMVEGKVVSYEAMRLEADASGTVVFVAKPSGQSEGNFKLAKNDADGALFENAAHNFPQRVRYQLKSDGSLHARIEGSKDGKTRGVDFPMRRVSCD